jgi:DNA-binding transcriptional LysR family regulator
MDNRAGEMEVFMRVVQAGSFARAARSLALSPSAISKLIARLESRLGTRLIIRTTRTLQLTPEGETYYGRALKVVADIDETERIVSHGGVAPPSGKLRVNASIPFAVRHIVPLVPAFLAAYPLVELDLFLSDGLVDLIEDRSDVAIRVGPLRDSSLKARKLCEAPYVVVASPKYLKRHGTPETPADLMRNNCLAFNLKPTLNEWPFLDPATRSVKPMPVKGNAQANNGETVRRLAIDGLGIARLASFHVRDDIERGRLVPILERFNPGDLQPIHAVFVGHEHLATRIRAFVDFIADRIPRTVAPPTAAKHLRKRPT